MSVQYMSLCLIEWSVADAISIELGSYVYVSYSYSYYPYFEKYRCQIDQLGTNATVYLYSTNDS